MKKWNLVRITGLVVAVGLIIFGSAENLWRTIRFGWERIIKN